MRFSFIFLLVFAIKPFLVFSQNKIDNDIEQGLIFNDNAYDNLGVKHSKYISNNQSLPKKVDWSQFVPDILNQQKTGTCVGMSTAYYMRTILEAKRLGITEKEQINKLSFSPSYIYNAIKDTSDVDPQCKLGTEIEAAFEFLKRNGALKYIDQGFPYCGKNKSIVPENSSKILDYNKLFGLEETKENKVEIAKKALFEGTPVVVGIITTTNMKILTFWETLWQKILDFLHLENTLGLWEPTKASLKGGHAICIVGYDDEKFSGAFHAVNSAGEQYGDNGFFWIKYQDFIEYAKYGYQAYVLPNNENQKYSLSAQLTIAYPSHVGEESVAFISNLESKNNFHGALKTSELAAYSLLKPQYSDTDFNFSVNVVQQTYLYVIGENREEKISGKLFPSTLGTSAFIGNNTEVFLPQKDSTYYLFDPIGTEYWAFLFSEKELDIDVLVDSLNVSKYKSLEFMNKINAVLNEELIQPKFIDYKLNKMGFDLKTKHNGSIVPVLVSLKHISKPRL